MTKYKQTLILYFFEIHDMFWFWQHDKQHPDWFEEFKNDLNNYTKLDWNTEGLSTSVNFLDLTISLEAKGKLITYKTFQKPMNLFLYIPGHSAHPPGVVKSLIFGLLQTYFRQNKKESDFDMIVKQLFRRLLSRGYHIEDIHPIFLEAATKIDMMRAARQSKQSNNVYTTSSNNRSTANKNKDRMRTDIFFHLPYHPRDISRKLIQEYYHKTCENNDNLDENFTRMTTQSGSIMRISKLTVAYSRAKNLRDILCSSTLKDLDNHNVSDFL